MGFHLPTSTGEFTGFLNHQQYATWLRKETPLNHVLVVSFRLFCIATPEFWGFVDPLPAGNRMEKNGKLGRGGWEVYPEI